MTDQQRLDLAERVCLMVGWTGASNTDRGKALHELWREWLAAYEAAGENASPRAHPELSDDAIQGLVERRNATVARTLEALSVKP